MLRAFASIILLSLAASGSATSQSLKDLRAQDLENGALAREAAYTSEICGVAIASSIDWSRARTWPASESLSGSCDTALGALETTCRNGKRDLVNRFVCTGDGSGASLAGKTLRYGATPGVSGFAETKALLDAQ